MFLINKLPASLPAEAFKQALAILHSKSDETAYACFNDGTGDSCLAVSLSGYQERFASISLLKAAQCPVLAVQDPYAPWYTGSKICAGMDEIEKTIRTYFPKARHFIFIGQSSGGYAAMVLAQRFENSVAVAFSPQTFDDRAVKRDSLLCPPSFNPVSTPEIEDVYKIYKNAKNPNGNQKTYIVVSQTETENPPEDYFWCDALHWARMAGLPDVKIIMGLSSKHPLLIKNTQNFIPALGYLTCPDPDHAVFFNWLLKATRTLRPDNSQNRT